LIKAYLKVIKELSIHTAIEEELLYPTIKLVENTSKELVSEALKEHQEVKELLYKLDQKSNVDKEYIAIMDEVIKARTYRSLITP
jgi:hypothetical protein